MQSQGHSMCKRSYFSTHHHQSAVSSHGIAHDWQHSHGLALWDLSNIITDLATQSWAGTVGFE